MPEVPSQWFSERLSFNDKYDVCNPNEVVENYGLMLGQFLIELRRKPLNNNDRDIQNFLRWMSGQVHDMVKVSAQSDSICLYETGPGPLSGRIYRDGMMYDKIPLSMHDILFIDDAIPSFVPDSFPQDRMPGFADSNQMFFVDIHKGIALSANQALIGLCQGGSIEAYPRKDSVGERR